MLKTDIEKLYEVIKAFYTITRIKIAVYSSDFEEIAAYPREQQGLCGLTEVAAPLIDHGQEIGYVIFGQITNESDREVFTKEVLYRCRNYPFAASLLQSLAGQIRFVSEDQINALSFVLGMITSYITANHLAYAAARPPAYEILDYISTHLEQDLSVEALCMHFSVSRSGLYQITKSYMPGGVAEHVKAMRLQKAKTLLQSTDTPIWQIAEQVGFRDYDYFLRWFKKTTGTSAGKFRKEGTL